MSKRTQYRDSETGQWTTKQYSANNPRTTEKERISVPPPKPQGGKKK